MKGVESLVTNNLEGEARRAGTLLEEVLLTSSLRFIVAIRDPAARECKRRRMEERRVIVFECNFV